MGDAVADAAAAPFASRRSSSTGSDRSTSPSPRLPTDTENSIEACRGGGPPGLRTGECDRVAELLFVCVLVCVTLGVAVPVMEAVGSGTSVPLGVLVLVGESKTTWMSMGVSVLVADCVRVCVLVPVAAGDVVAALVPVPLMIGIEVGVTGSAPGERDTEGEAD